MNFRFWRTFSKKIQCTSFQRWSSTKSKYQSYDETVQRPPNDIQWKPIVLGILGGLLIFKSTEDAWWTFKNYQIFHSKPELGYNTTPLNTRSIPNQKTESFFALFWKNFSIETLNFIQDFNHSQSLPMAALQAHSQLNSKSSIEQRTAKETTTTLKLEDISNEKLVKYQVKLAKFRIPVISFQTDTSRTHFLFRFLDFSALVDIQIPTVIQSSQDGKVVLHAEVFSHKGTWRLKQIYLSDRNGKSIYSRNFFQSEDKDGIPFVDSGLIRVLFG